MNFYTSAIENRGQILLRGYENGRQFTRKVKYEPTLFVSNNKSDSPWKSIHGKPLAPMVFPSIYDAKEFSKKYENVTNFEICGLTRFVYAYLNEEYLGEVRYDRELIRVVNIDIEVASNNGFPSVDAATQEITAITLKKNNIFYVFGCGVFNTNRADVKYVRCKNERELLLAFIAEWSRGGYPDAVTGWNIAYFDIPYIINRMKHIFEQSTIEQLSPWKAFSSRVVKINGRENTTISILGVATLDYLEMYRKFTYTQQESYRLDDIAQIELGDQKLDYSEYETLHELYEKNFQKFIEYNIHDVDIVDRLDDKMKLIDMVLTLAYDAKVNYEDVFSQVRMWDVLIHNHLWAKNIAVPPNKEYKKDAAYTGGHVKFPKIGMHDWIVSFDLNSLYPHLIMQFNVGPDTISGLGSPGTAIKDIDISIDDLLDENKELPIIEGHSLAANGVYFSNEKRSFLAEMLQRLYEDRARYKIKMIEAQKAYETEIDNKKKRELIKNISRYKNMQMAKKIQLNSSYGAIGNPHFRYFDLRLAMAITLGGQLAIRWAENGINKYMNTLLGTQSYDYVIAADTDSLYIDFSGLVRKVFKDPSAVSKARVVSFLDDVAREKFKPLIDLLYKNLAIRTNSFQQKMNMTRESIADRGLWTAKKRYILNVYDSEGVRYNEPKLKIMGIEAVKSSTPKSCRSAIKTAINIIMTGTQESLHEYIIQFRKKFNTLRFEDIAFPRGINSELYKQDGGGDQAQRQLPGQSPSRDTVPIHVRGALLFNKSIKSLNLTRKYELIKSGEKIKFCYLLLPNPMNDNVISILSTLPKEFNLDKYIDYDTQFDKAFLGPMRTILNAIKWSEEKRNTVEDFFA